MEHEITPAYVALRAASLHVANYGAEGKGEKGLTVAQYFGAVLQELAVWQTSDNKKFRSLL
jgi:hypothetical protein